MVSPRPRRVRRQTYPDSIVLILTYGADFFNELDGPIEQHLDMLHEAWSDEGIRQQVFVEMKDKAHVPWAQEKWGNSL